MMSTPIIAVALIVTLLLGFFTGKALGKNKQQNLLRPTIEKYTQEINFLNQQHQQKSAFEQERLQGVLQELTLEKSNAKALQQLVHETEILLSKKETEFDALLENLKTKERDQVQLQERFQTEFENIANKILEEKSSKFTVQNQENIKNILGPLQERIQHFEKKVDDTQKVSIDYHVELRTQIHALKELSVKMNQETLNLTKALKSESKTQGNWGELILEKVLEKSGLEAGREYTKQHSAQNEDGKRLQPDVLVHLPDGKCLVVDSKVSLTAYERYINASDAMEKQTELKLHLQSINNHVQELSNKNYNQLFGDKSPNFVLLFIPNESAFAVALNEDAHLYSKAFDKDIIIVTPTTLLATLRTIDSMWTNQKQQENAREIARQAGALYDKFEGLVTDLHKIGSRIKDSEKEYESALNKLSTGKGNLIRSVERLKEMGANAKKSLPEQLIQQSRNADEAV